MQIWDKLGNIKNSPKENDFDKLEENLDDQVSQNFMCQMATLDVLSRILRLHDLLNNTDNFGFIQRPDSLPVLRIVDFRVDDEKAFRIVKSDFRGFLVGNGPYNYAASHKAMRYVLRERNSVTRRQTALQLFLQNPLMSLGDHIIQAYQDISEYIQDQPEDFAEYKDTLMAQLTIYKNSVLENVLFFHNCLRDPKITENPKHDSP